MVLGLQTAVTGSRFAALFGTNHLGKTFVLHARPDRGFVTRGHRDFLGEVEQNSLKHVGQPLTRRFVKKPTIAPEHENVVVRLLPIEWMVSQQYLGRWNKKE